MEIKEGDGAGGMAGVQEEDFEFSAQQETPGSGGSVLSLEGPDAVHFSKISVGRGEAWEGPGNTQVAAVLCCWALGKAPPGSPESGTSG